MTKKRVTPSYFDTSIFLEYLKLPTPKANKYLDSTTSNGRRMASSYSVIEMNKRLLVVAINFYDTINELRDVASAKIELSNKWGREPKYYLILDGIVERNKTSDFKNDYKSYLALLEIIIVDIQDKIYTLVHSFNGDFKSHPLYKTRIFSKDNFEQLRQEGGNFNPKDFLDTWKKDQKQLEQASQYFDNLKTKKKLNKIETEIDALVKELLKDYPSPTWKNMGDLLIALNSPKSHNLLAHDNLFSTLGNMLSKPTLYITFPK